MIITGMEVAKQAFLLMVLLMYFVLFTNGKPFYRNKFQNFHTQNLENDVHLGQLYNAFIKSGDSGPVATVGQQDFENIRPNEMVKKALSLFAQWRPRMFNDNDDDDSDVVRAVARGSFTRPLGQPLRWG
ncbi:uncharacterized protein LOC111087636 [Limulus polyphemus]|uniref:Uncharacterized protein LOC111087636 n=1 Tax=Limulus polyphemus TaxID=6850 RepID=A0ABM1T441_LIMPO|nr:uncharacterized protein LOC111087636 [Limulus polyphemus]